MSDLLLVTPTGDRPEAFGLCERWMERQTYRGEYDWVVVDDGEEPTVTTRGQEVVRRQRQASDPAHSLPVQLLAAFDQIESAEAVLVIEDDDYYGPTYIQTMIGWLNDAPLAGEIGAKYYHLSHGWRVFSRHDHASLCRTGLLPGDMFDHFCRVVHACASRGSPSIDIPLWNTWTGPSFGFHDERGDARLCVGIKGMPGRPSTLHKSRRNYATDPDYRKLAWWVGDDWRHYVPFAEAAKREPERGAA